MKFKIYQDKKKKWRWSLVARNGKIIADSGQGYARKQNALYVIGLIQGEAYSAKIEEA